MEDIAMPNDAELSKQLRELVRRMGKARNQSTRTYMPTALLAVCDLAEQGKVRDGIVEVADYRQAFKRLMLEVLPEREDMWFRPLLHVTQHAMWRLRQAGQEVHYLPRKISRLQNERQASKLADAFLLDPVLCTAISLPERRTELRRLVYELLSEDGEEVSTRLAQVHAHLDPGQGDSELLRELVEYEHRVEDRDAFADDRQWRPGERVVRTGQPQFRAALLRAYGSRCCMSDADAPRALEAAHILPFRGARSNGTSNGLLLRGDLHTLFDDGLITVDAIDNFAIHLHPTLIATNHYRELHHRPLRLPARREHHPDRDALDWHHRKNRA